jgi:hypothetical protein
MSRHSIENFNQAEFAAEIRAFMEKHNITTRQFPKIFKKPYTSFCRIEDNRHGVTIKTAQELIEAMNNYQKFVDTIHRRIVSNKKS